MGSIYAEGIVLGEWMLNLDKLAVSLSRAFIYQEMAFGELDKEAVGGLFEQLRERGRHARSRGVLDDVDLHRHRPMRTERARGGAAGEGVRSEWHDLGNSLHLQRPSDAERGRQRGDRAHQRRREAAGGRRKHCVALVGRPLSFPERAHHLRRMAAEA